MNKENIKLVIIGESNESEHDQVTKEKLNNYSNDEKVIYLGQRIDIPELLYISDVFYLPSYREGIPRIIIEAMAMECSIVATKIRGSREEVDYCINGYLVPLKSIESLSQALDRIISNEERLNVFNTKARKKQFDYMMKIKSLKCKLKFLNEKLDINRNIKHMLKGDF